MYEQRIKFCSVLFIGPKVTTCSKAHRSQSAHFPQNTHFLKYPFVPVPTCPFVPNIHSAKALICPHYPMPICSGAHFSWCPFSPNAHLLPMPTCPNVHQSQTAHLPHKCPLALMLIFPGAHFPQCPFSPNAHLPQCPLLVPRCPLCSKVPICHKYLFALVSAHFSWCPFSPSAHLLPMSTCPYAHLSQKFSFAQLSAPNIHLPR